MADLIGKQLGNYEIKQVIGKGGMSTVYLGEQPSIGRRVAIKVLPREFMHDDTFLQRFQQEVRTVTSLEHPHILPVYDAGEQDGIPYIVMRYLSGGTLTQLLNQALPDSGTIVRIVSQIASALDYAHERDVIHRDLKPSNILLDDKGNAYLTDFGVARTSVYEGGLTGSRVIGTPPYIAPEAIRKNDIVTGLADVYGLGVITFEMLTGEPPYRDDDPMKVLIAHVMEPIPSARALNPKVSITVDAVVRRCLAKTANERHASAGTYAAALERAYSIDEPSVETVPHVPILSPSDTQPSRAVARPPQQAVDPHPVPTAEDEKRGFGCVLPVVVGGVLLAVTAAAILILSGRTPQAILGSLTPIPTFELTEEPSGDPTSPAIKAPSPTPPPDAVILPPPAGGGRLAFASNADGDFDIYTIEADGSNLTNLTNNDTASDFDPAWSPDGTRIAFARNPNPQQGGSDPDIWIMNADGTGQAVFRDDSAIDADPAWSPDGRWLAYTSTAGGTFDIYVAPSDGSGEACRLTQSAQNAFTPRWSPDGRFIAYHARVGTDYATSDLYVIEIDMTRPCAERVQGSASRITDNDVRDEWVDWSPDGTRIVYSTQEGIDADGRALVIRSLTNTDDTVYLTEGTFRDDDPTWSPDGTHIAFDSDRDGEGRFDIYLLDVATGEITQLTFDASDNVVPVWQP